ncbi:hypothetical protein [Epilithonimonas xixisoli]|uniref:hypothetical protein n=1 Tax=Epilithonimonas xixisoli TaxID=1476462 RepID=UPI0010640EAF|nr:hypothetical protein [Epilithonimonas xixisoli]
MDFFYIGIIVLLSFIISILIRKIYAIKKNHQRKLTELYQKLALLNSVTKQDELKLQLNQDFSTKIENAKLRLNEDIFDLQMDVFRKISEN